MRPGIERRSNEAPRIPLDLWIRLSHEDFEEPFDADGVDLSAGGLAMRSDYLPEVGDRLRCRFDCPPEGGEVEVDGEVVWAHDAGERSGEFGVRFETLDVEAEDSLRQLVEHLGGAPTAGSARLHLDGVATPIDAQIVERDDEWLVAEQELTFLRIGMGVVLEGTNGPPRGRLASVDVRIDDGTPRLVLGVEYAPVDGRHVETLDEEPPRDVHTAETLDNNEPSAVEARADTLDRVEATNEATVQDFELPEDLRAGAEGSLEDVDDEELVERDAVQIFRVQRDHGAAHAITPDQRAAHDPADARAADVEAAAPQAGLEGLKQRLAPVWHKTREAAGTWAAKAKPAALAAWTKIAALFAVLVEKAGPRARSFGAKLGAAFAAIGARIGAKMGKRAKRRTTAAPPKRVAQSPRLRRQRAEQEAERVPEKKKNRRILILSVLAFAGVGSAVYALTGSEAQAPEPPINSPTIPAPPPEMDEEEPSDDPAPPPEEGDIDPEQGDAPDTEPPPAGAAQAEGGRLGEPTYPSLRDATERREQPMTEGQTFGDAEVPNGRSATVRMSNPVTTIRGQRQDGGFTVTVPGALALDRAGPIAAANPDVERAMILNRGDHSVLTVTFVAGRSPAYRVAAHGSAVEITIGR